MSKPHPAKAHPALGVTSATSAQPEADKGSALGQPECLQARDTKSDRILLGAALGWPWRRQQGTVHYRGKGKAVTSLLTSSKPKGILAEKGWSSSLDTEEIIRQETYELLMGQLSTRLGTFITSFEKKITRMGRNQTVQNALARHTFIILQPYCQQNRGKKFGNHPFFSPGAVQCLSV